MLNVQKSNTDINIDSMNEELFKQISVLDPVIFYLMNSKSDGEMILNKRLKTQIIKNLFGYEESKTMSNLSYIILTFLWYSAQQS